MDKIKLRPMNTAPRGRHFFVVYDNAMVGKRIGQAYYKKTTTGWRLTSGQFNLSSDLLDGWIEPADIMKLIEKKEDKKDD